MSLFDAPLLTRAQADGRYAVKASNTTFNVREYGAVGDGTTDDRVAIQNAFNAAMTYANTAAKTATVFFPPAIYRMTGSINWSGANVGMVTLAGPATILFGAANTLFLNATWNSSIGNYGNVTVQDLLFDNANTTKNWGSNGIILNINKSPAQQASIKNITVQRCEVRNAPRTATFGLPFVVGVDINMGAYSNSERIANCVIDNITVQDCIFGRIGYGGDFAVRIQGLVGNSSAYGGTTTASRIRSGEYHMNTVMTNITLKRLWHDGGPAAQTYWSNSNYIIGGAAHGDNVVCEDLYGDHTGDDGLEVNSFLNVDINRCEFRNALTGAGMLLTNGGGMPTPERQSITVRNCTIGPSDQTNGGLNPWDICGIRVRYAPGGPHGTLRFENIRLIDGQILVRAAFQQLSIKDVSYAQTIDIANGGPLDLAPIEIDHFAGKGQIDIDGVTATYGATYNNPNSTPDSAVSIAAVRLVTLADVVLSARNVQLVHKITATGTAIANGGPEIATVRLPKTYAVNQSGLSTQANFSSGNNGEWGYDSGASTDVTVSGGTLNPSGTATLTNEVRTFAVAAHTDYWTTAVGPQTDINVEIQFTPGATITGFKGGVTGKVIDANNYTEAYVYDDNTNSYLCLDKVVAGVRTSLLGTVVGGAGTVTTIDSPPANVSAKGIQLAARIASGTSFYVRYRQQGTAVRADYHSDPMAYGTTSTQAATATFTTQTDIQTFVEPPAFSGYVWVPQAADAKIDNFNYYRMYVISGSLTNLSFTSISKSPVGAAHNVVNGLTSATTRIVNGPLRIVNSGVGRHAGLASTVTEINTLNDLGAFIRSENNRNQDGAITAPVAPSSGAAYVASSGQAEVVHWYGGTLTTPFVEVSLDGGTTWSQIRNASADGSVTLQPGDRARWTYSSAPTFKRVLVG